MNFLYSYKQIKQLILLATDTHKRIWNDTYSILLTVEGKSELNINDSKVMLYPGTVTFCNRDCFLEFDVMPGHDLNIFILSFHILHLIEDAATNALAYEEYREPWLDNGPIYGVSFYRTSEIMKELMDSNEAQQHNSDLAKQALLYELLSSVQAEKSSMPATSSHHGEAIQQVINYIYHHYQEDITRDGMAKFIGFHPRFFSKIFKAETGFGFTQYVAKIRIDKAKEQLLLTDLNLNDIATNVGYSNGLYLSRKFKQLTGSSPMTYLNNITRIVAYDWLGNVLALGIKPVGASYFYGLHDLHILRDLLDGIEDVGRSSIDAVIALEPELIIVPKWLGPSLLNKLPKIAPTIVVPYGNSFERFLSLAHTLKKEQQAEAFITRYKQRAHQVKTSLQTIIYPNETVGLYELSPSRTIWAFNQFHGRGGYNLFQEMAFTPPPMIKKHVMSKDTIKELSLDQLPQYAADHMIISYPFDAESKEYTTEIMNHPIWQSIAAYQNNRIYFIDKRIFHANDVYSLYRQLTLQEQLLLGHGRDHAHPCTFVHEIKDLKT